MKKINFLKFNLPIAVVILLSFASSAGNVVVDSGNVAGGDVTGNRICIGADCRAAWPSAGSGSQWTTTGSDIFFNTGNVAIGTNSPGFRLHVANDIASTSEGFNLQLGCTGSNCWTNANGVIGFPGAGIRHGSIAFYPNSNALALIDSSAGSPMGDYGALSQSLNFNDLWAGNGIFKGNVGIGTSSPSEKLTVNGNVLAAAYFYSSDANLKTNIRQLEGLKTISALRGVSFDWKADGRKDVGLIAQDVEKVLPELVATDSATGLKYVKYGNLVAPLIEATKELEEQNKNQTTRISDMEKELDLLRTEIRELKSKQR